MTTFTTTRKAELLAAIENLDGDQIVELVIDGGRIDIGYANFGQYSTGAPVYEISVYDEENMTILDLCLAVYTARQAVLMVEYSARELGLRRGRAYRATRKPR